MILDDELELWWIISTDKVMDPDTLAYVQTDTIRDLGTVGAHVGSARGLAAFDKGWSAWLDNDEVEAIIRPAPSLFEAPSAVAIRARWQGRRYVGLAVQPVHRNGRPHHYTLRLKRSREKENPTRPG